MKKIFSGIGFYTFCPFWCLTLLLTLVCFRTTLFAEQKNVNKPSQADFIQKTQKLRIPFIANEGQINSNQVRFYATTFEGSIFITKDGEIVYSLQNSKDGKKDTLFNRGSSLQNNLFNTGYIIQDTQCRFNILHRASGISYQNCICCLITNRDANSDKHHRKAIALKEAFVGGKVNKIQGVDKAVTKVNYFRGNDSSKWKSNISTYDVVTLGEVYKGIDLKLRAYGNNVEKLFCVKPNAKPDEIKVKISGAKALKVNEEGQLEAETDLGTVKFTKPLAYQEIDGKRVEVNVDYQIQNSGVRGQNTKTSLSCQKSKFQNPKSEIENIYCFKVASYDKTKELVIDPLLASTFLGGSTADFGHSLAIDSDGNVYVTGITTSPDFPTTTGAYDTSYNASADAFVSKFDGDLTNLLASTFLGGSRYDEGNSIALDSDGNVYVAGLTQSVNFPANFNAYDNTFNGDSDVFVSKFNGDLTNLLASTFLGGTSEEYTYSIALDSGRNVYVTGWTDSSDFPTTKDAYDTSYNGNVDDEFDSDAFVSKLNGNLTNLLASTYLGGSSFDNGYSLDKHLIALDSDGNVYVTGNTTSPDFPTTTGAYDNSYNGDVDVFVSKLNGNLTNLLASTYLGSSFSAFGFPGYDEGFSIALDSDGNVYVTGYTDSLDFPTTLGAYDIFYNDNGGSTDVFISKLNGDLKNLLASTYLGGSSVEVAKSLSIDSNGNIYVTGSTGSSDFPTTSGAYDNSYNGNGDDSYGDAFVSKLNGNLTSLLGSTYLGGSDNDYARSIAIDPDGNVYVSGSTYSSDFPTTPGAYDTSYNISCVFISKFDSDLSSQSCEATHIIADPKRLKLNKEESVDVWVTVTGNEGCTVSGGETVTAEIKLGKRLVSVFPQSGVVTDVNGQAVFTITAQDETGNALIIFRTDDMRTFSIVRVRE